MSEIMVAAQGTVRDADIPNCCPCGSEWITFQGGAPYTCAEAFFALHDSGAIVNNGQPRPTLVDGVTEHDLTLFEHLTQTQVWLDAPWEERAP